MFVLCSRENISYHFRTIQPLEKVAMRDDVAAQSGYNKVKLGLKNLNFITGSYGILVTRRHNFP